jgi:hypothetical protein
MTRHHVDFSGPLLDTAFTADQQIGQQASLDLAVCCGRDNLLFKGIGRLPGNIVATIVDGLEVIAQACHDGWRSGGVRERLVHERLEGDCAPGSG